MSSIRRLLAGASAALVFVGPGAGIRGQDLAFKTDTVPAKSFEELLARSGEEQVRAEFHDYAGEPLRDRPNMFVVNESGMVPTPAWPPGAAPPSKPLQTRQTRLDGLVCRTDGIVVGSVKTKRVLLNRSETALFTDFSFEVGQWLRPARTTLSVIVTEGGGKVTVDGNVYMSTMFRDMPMGRPYLLFLQGIPRTVSFHTTVPPIPILDGSVDLVSMGPVQDPHGSEPLKQVAAELQETAKRCTGK